MEAYLDNSATTRVHDSVRDIVNQVMTVDFGNPSSLHTKGVESERYLREARRTMAALLKVHEKEIIFTSGGTESNNLAIIGAALANRRMGRHLITTRIEHASVHAPMEFLAEQGFTVTSLAVDAQGHISLEELREAVREDTILVSIMYVNNEIGAVQPIAEAARIIKERNPRTLFHVDAIQAFGKYEIYPSRMGIDLLSISGHKFHGPKGTGVLYRAEGAKISPILFGGGQQRGMRSGTDNVPGAAGIALAAKEAYTNRLEKTARMTACKDALIDRLLDMPEVRVNSQRGQEGAPHIVSASFPGVRSEVLLHTLEERGIYVSAGSACSSNKPAVSKTLQAIHLPADLLTATLRFSFCEDTSLEEVLYAADVIAEVLPMLRRFRAK